VKPTFLNAFSWKQGFLENKQKHTSSRNGHRNDISKGLTKVASLDATIDQNSYQQTITMSAAVAMTTAAHSQATDPAILLASTGSETTCHMTHVCETQANTSASPTSNGLIPSTTKGFDKGHLHCTSPICGLLPKENTHTFHTREERQDKLINPASNLAATMQQTKNSPASTSKGIRLKWMKNKALGQHVSTANKPCNQENGANIYFRPQRSLQPQ